MRVILGEYSLRPVKDEDAGLILEWRNSDRVRKQMLNQEIIRWDEHNIWFEKIKNEEVVLHFIFEYLERPIGFAYITDYNSTEKKCSSGMYLGEVNDVPLDAGIILRYMQAYYIFEVLRVENLLDSTKITNRRVLKNNLMGARIVKNENGIIWFLKTRDTWSKTEGKLLSGYIDKKIKIIS